MAYGGDGMSRTALPCGTGDTPDAARSMPAATPGLRSIGTADCHPLYADGGTSICTGPSGTPSTSRPAEVNSMAEARAPVMVRD